MTAYTYILRCSDGSLYTGWTMDLQKRVHDHNHSEKGAKYTKARRPCKLVYYEVFESDDQLQAKRLAMQREWFIKNKYNKMQKENLIKDFVSDIKL